MYQKDTQYTSSFKSKTLYYSLIFLRFLSSFFVLFLLLSPLVHRKYNIEEKPIIGIAIDNSTSILNSKVNDKKDIESKVKYLQDKLEGKCTVVPFSFGTQCQSDSLYSFAEKETDISQALEYFDESYMHQNPVALVVASDGLYNKGINPIYTSLQKKYPIYTIALGDTTVKKDTRIEDVHHNTFAYLGDKTSIEIDLGADFASGSSTNLSIYEISSAGSVKISTQQIAINSNSFVSTQALTVECKKAGIIHYRAVLDAVKGEDITQNNSFDFFVEVLDGRKKILIVGASPHPDMSALKQSLQNSKNYEVDITFDQSLLPKIESYNLIVMHQMPSQSDNASAWIQKINTLKIPALFIVGSQSNFSIFSSIQNNISAQLQANVHQDILPRVNSNFELFSLTDQTKATANTFPPLQIDLSSVSAKSAGSTLMYQKIGSVETQYPMIFFGDNNGVKNGYIIGTGLWKWNLSTFATTNNHEAFDEIIHKIANYLSVKKDARPFRTNLSKSTTKVLK
jgi:hypothetical protein